jgi:ATP-dependent exoDNAse (exonuclease V) beta subunit
VASYRSGPALIEMVNVVFGSAATLAELYPGPASATWNREWRPHESAVPERRGQAALLHGEDERERWTITRELLLELDPVAHGLSCAVLVKQNDTGAALADFLRQAGIPAIAEADLHIATDNPLGAGLLALLQAVAHPGDTFAQTHLRMTPLGDVAAAVGLATPEALTRHVLGQVHGFGFERTMEDWVRRLEPVLAPDDAFSRQRAREFVAAAGLFDATGGRDLDEFIAFMQRHTARPPESASVVRVMTIHKSKGLGFDVVIVPDLQGNRIDERREGLAVRKTADRTVEWVLDLPTRMFCEQDEVLAAYLRAAEADACYEKLSLLYVALTRAKRAMYVVTEPAGTSKSRNFPRLLADTLGDDAKEIVVGRRTFRGPWSSGDADWIAQLPLVDLAGRPASAPPVTLLTTEAATARRVARRASAERHGRVPAPALFAFEAVNAAAFGTELHAQLAQVEWATAADVPGWLQRWRKTAVTPAVAEAAARCLAAPAFAEVWRRPAGRAEVWRERAFEVVLEEVWLTGVFDRVVVERDGEWRARRATVFDFKTDRVDEPDELVAAANRYREQLETYRRVAAVLTGLPPGDVQWVLVFTHPGKLVPLHTLAAPAGKPRASSSAS